MIWDGHNHLLSAITGWTVQIHMYAFKCSPEYVSLCVHRLCSYVCMHMSARFRLGVHASMWRLTGNHKHVYIACIAVGPGITAPSTPRTWTAWLARAWRSSRGTVPSMSAGAGHYSLDRTCTRAPILIYIYYLSSPYSMWYIQPDLPPLTRLIHSVTHYLILSLTFA